MMPPVSSNVPTEQSHTQSRTQSLKARFDQADKEACLTLAVYIGYILWWAVCAYGFGGQDPDTYTYIWGFPAWFFYACVLGYPLLNLVLWAVIVIFFKEMSLEDDDNTILNIAESADTNSEKIPLATKDMPLN